MMEPMKGTNQRKLMTIRKDRNGEAKDYQNLKRKKVAPKKSVSVLLLAGESDSRVLWDSSLMVG